MSEFADDPITPLLHTEPLHQIFSYLTATNGTSTPPLYPEEFLFVCKHWTRAVSTSLDAGWHDIVLPEDLRSSDPSRIEQAEKFIRQRIRLALENRKENAFLDVNPYKIDVDTKKIMGPDEGRKRAVQVVFGEKWCNAKFVRRLVLADGDIEGQVADGMKMPKLEDLALHEVAISPVFGDTPNAGGAIIQFPNLQGLTVHSYGVHGIVRLRDEFPLPIIQNLRRLKVHWFSEADLTFVLNSAPHLEHLGGRVDLLASVMKIAHPKLKTFDLYFVASPGSALEFFTPSLECIIIATDIRFELVPPGTTTRSKLKHIELTLNWREIPLDFFRELPDLEYLESYMTKAHRAKFKGRLQDDESFSRM